MQLEDLAHRFMFHAKERRIWHPRRLQCALGHINAFLAFTLSGPRLQGRPTTAPGSDRLMRRLDADAVVRADVADWLWDLAHSKVRGGKPICITTVSEYRKTVLSMYAWASEAGHVAEAVADSIERAKMPEQSRTPARKARDVQAVPDAVLDRLIVWCTDKVKAWKPVDKREAKNRDAWRRFTLAIMLFRHTGMRREELCRMAPSDIRFKIEENKEPEMVYAPGEHKTAHHGHERNIVLSDSAQAALFEAVEILEREDRGQSSFGWVPIFPNWSDGDSFYRFFVKALKKAGLPHYTPHQIRHLFGTKGVRVNLEGTRVQMGHRDIRTTMRYVDDRMAAAAAVVRELDRPVSPSPAQGEGPTDSDDLFGQVP